MIDYISNLKSLSRLSSPTKKWTCFVSLLTIWKFTRPVLEHFSPTFLRSVDAPICYHAPSSNTPSEQDSQDWWVCWCKPTSYNCFHKSSFIRWVVLRKEETNQGKKKKSQSVRIRCYPLGTREVINICFRHI